MTQHHLFLSSALPSTFSFRLFFCLSSRVVTRWPDEMTLHAKKNHPLSALRPKKNSLNMVLESGFGFSFLRVSALSLFSSNARLAWNTKTCSRSCTRLSYPQSFQLSRLQNPGKSSNSPLPRRISSL
jgi:hypothetical protein